MKNNVLRFDMELLKLDETLEYMYAYCLIPIGAHM